MPRDGDQPCSTKRSGSELRDKLSSNTADLEIICHMFPGLFKSVKCANGICASHICHEFLIMHRRAGRISGVQTNIMQARRMFQ